MRFRMRFRATCTAQKLESLICTGLCLHAAIQHCTALSVIRKKGRHREIDVEDGKAEKEKDKEDSVEGARGGAQPPPQSQPQQPSGSAPVVRKSFPETWIWIDSEIR